MKIQNKSKKEVHLHPIDVGRAHDTITSKCIPNHFVFLVIYMTHGWKFPSISFYKVYLFTHSLRYYRLKSTLIISTTADRTVEYSCSFHTRNLPFNAICFILYADKSQFYQYYQSQINVIFI